MAEGIELLEELDTFADLRNSLRNIANGTGEWAGIPMPLEGARLVVEPRFPHAELLSSLCANVDTEADKKVKGAKIKIRNRWYSHRKRCEIVIFEEDGKLRYGWLPAFHHISYDLNTLGASVVWGIEQEAAAVKTLAEMIPHHAFKYYMLTGMFLETSHRSGVTYLFRRLKPTVALSTRTGEGKILCALCLHPIAYYEDSWAGAMCPTDDVIAHLSLMRGDEHLYWRRASQHPAYRPEAGL